MARFMQCFHTILRVNTASGGNTLQGLQGIPWIQPGIRGAADLAHPMISCENQPWRQNLQFSEQSSSLAYQREWVHALSFTPREDTTNPHWLYFSRSTDGWPMFQPRSLAQSEKHLDKEGRLGKQAKALTSNSLTHSTVHHIINWCFSPNCEVCQNLIGLIL